MRLAAAVAAAGLLLSGCLGITIDGSIEVVVDATPYGFGATLDFGIVDPDGEPATINATIQNISDADLVVTGISVEGSAFGVSAPQLPRTIESAGETAVSLTFDPDGSGAFDGSILVTIQRGDVPFVVNLAGEGNFAPVAFGAVTVQGGDLPAIRGTYRRAGSITGPAYDQGSQVDVDYDFPVYELSGTDYVIYAYDDGPTNWALDDDDDSGDGTTLLYGQSRTYAPAHALVAPSGTTAWVPQGQFGGPTITGEIDASSGEYAGLGETISINYLFEDAEDDLEGDSTYQWYQSDFIGGPYSEITNATAPTLALEIEHYFKYLTCEVTPVAATGIPVGTTVTLGPIFVYGD